VSSQIKLEQQVLHSPTTRHRQLVCRCGSVENQSGKFATLLPKLPGKSRSGRRFSFIIRVKNVLGGYGSSFSLLVNLSLSLCPSLPLRACSALYVGYSSSKPQQRRQAERSVAEKSSFAATEALASAWEERGGRKKPKGDERLRRRKAPPSTGWIGVNLAAVLFCILHVSVWETSAQPRSETLTKTGDASSRGALE
jgi:hypothetical protein